MIFAQPSLAPRNLASIPIPVKRVPDCDVTAPLRMSWGRGYDHQIFGLGLLMLNPRFLLAWEMGTGKSAVIARRLLAADAAKWHTLIVAPKSVVYVWQEQLREHAKLNSIIIEGSPDERRWLIAEAWHKGWPTIINYELLHTHADTLSARYYDCVVADECHRIKNIKTAASRAIRKISKHSKWRYALSGTPAPNSPLDIFGTLTFLNPDIIGTPYLTQFRNRYAIMGTAYPCQIKQYKNLDDLNARTESVSMAITKEECLDLPPKIFESRHCDLTPEQARVYRDLRRDAITRLSSAKGDGELSVDNILTESLRLLQVVGGYVPDDERRVHPLPSAKMAVLDDLVEELGPEPAIIWAPFRAEVIDIANRLGERAVLHDGSLSGQTRREAIRRFVDGEVQFFVSTPQSAREGLTLTRASAVIYYGRTYNLLDWLQTQDRAHRIGQNRPVTIVSIVARGTIDERIDHVLRSKGSLQEQLLKGAKVEDLL